MACFRYLEPEKLPEVYQNSGIVILFKHSTRCSISSAALNRLKDFCAESSEEVNAYMVDVIQEREISNQISSRLGIRHESPQLIVLKNGKPVYHRSHFEIVKNDLLTQINKLKQLS